MFREGQHIKSAELRVRRRRGADLSCWQRNGRVDKGTPLHAVLQLSEAEDDNAGDGHDVLPRA